MIEEEEIEERPSPGDYVSSARSRYRLLEGIVPEWIRLLNEKRSRWVRALDRRFSVDRDPRRGELIDDRPFGESGVL